MSAETSRKRPSIAPDDGGENDAGKRQRTGSLSNPPSQLPAQDATPRPRHPVLPSYDNQAKDGLRRSIALALQHVGFEGASEEALESFTAVTEKYLTSIVENLGSLASASRRSQAIPPDYEIVLKRFNIPTGTLRPHLKNPVRRREKLAPKYCDPRTLLVGKGVDPDKLDLKDLPLIGEELSGEPEKEGKPWIPASFPSFPSIHTFKATPIDVESVTVRGSGILVDGKPLEEVVDISAMLSHGASGTKTKAEETRRAGLAARMAMVRPSDGPRGDPQRLREAAALEAKQAEEALRRLMRASKVASLKEVRLNAERNPLRKQRFDVWEEAMRDLIDEKEGQNGPAPDSVTETSAGRGIKAAGGAGRREIADFAMMVNAEKKFYRKPVQKMLTTGSGGRGAKN